MAKPTAPLPPAPSPVPNPAPPGAWDTHIHMLAAPDEAPLFDGRVEDPGSTYADYLARYRAQLAALGVSRGVVVQSIFYGLDNTVTLRAVRDLGPGFCGIGLVPDDVDDATLDEFAANRLRGVRLNYVHGGVLSWAGAKAMAPRLADRGLHIQMLAHAHLHMAEIADDIAALPVPVVFDHIAWPDLSLGVNDPGFQALCRLMEAGHAYVKLSGLYRLCPAPFDQADAFVTALVATNPDRCLWGSDWPHIMLNGAEMPQAADLWAALHRAVPDADLRNRILCHTPNLLYGI